MQTIGSIKNKTNFFVKKEVKQRWQKKQPVQIKKKSNLFKNIIIINNRQIDIETAFYDWRLKTQFPIAKIERYKTKKCDKNHYIVEIQYEKYISNLSQIDDIPLFKMLYLLKQSIIGYQRLYNMVGAFTITSKMIFLNTKYQCKVWLNQNCIINKFNRTNQSERQFLINIYKIFEEKIKRNRSSISFFNQLKKIERFYGVLQFIQKYSHQNKICIPSFFVMNKVNKKDDLTRLKICQSAKNIVLDKYLIPNIKFNQQQPYSISFQPNLTFNSKPILAKAEALNISKKTIDLNQQAKKIKRVKSLHIDPIKFDLVNSENDPQKTKRFIIENILTIDKSKTSSNDNKIVKTSKLNKVVKIDKLATSQQFNTNTQLNSQQITIPRNLNRNEEAKLFIEEELSIGQSQIFYDSLLQQQFQNILSKNVQQDYQKIMDKICNRQKNDLGDYGKLVSSMVQQQ